jgi:hypothetical protein
VRRAWATSISMRAFLPKASIFTLLLSGTGFGIPSNDIEKAIGFEFIKYKIEVEVNHWNEGSGAENEFVFKATRTGEITNGDPTAFLVGIDSVRTNTGLLGMEPLCGCEGCDSKNGVVFSGLKNRKLNVEYGGCGGDFEVARFSKGKKRYVVYYSKEQAEKIAAIFKSLSQAGLKEFEEHFSSE